jgi:hypothetical protein
METAIDSDRGTHQSHNKALNSTRPNVRAFFVVTNLPAAAPKMQKPFAHNVIWTPVSLVRTTQSYLTIH